MQVNNRYGALFDKVRIGPVIVPNRFYQVPHCTGMGYARPKTLAAMRATKAEGGWGVVCTEYCSIHPSSDDDPYSPRKTPIIRWRSPSHNKTISASFSLPSAAAFLRAEIFLFKPAILKMRSYVSAAFFPP